MGETTPLNLLTSSVESVESIRHATFWEWQSVFLTEHLVRIRINPYQKSDIPVNWPKLFRSFENGYSTFSFSIIGVVYCKIAEVILFHHV